MKKFFLLTFFIFALQQSSIADGLFQVKTRAWPTKITIGDEIKLSVQISHPRNFSIVTPSPKTSVASFEIKSVAAASSRDVGEMVEQTFVLKLTVFQLGEQQIPPFPVYFTDPGGRSGQVWTEPVSIKVVSVIKNPKEKTDIRPIKGPISFDLTALRTLILALLDLMLIIWLIVKIVLRRRNKKLIDLESLKPPHERAMLELGRLQGKALLSDGKVKEFYSELADILRRYLERRFQVETLELTTFEIVKTLKEKEFSSDLIEKIKELLESSDLVKFAKYVPPRSWEERLTGILSNIVEKTKPAEEEAAKK